MGLPFVALASLGGTITMTSSAVGRGAAPTLSADELAATVPELSGVARMETVTLASVPSASLSFADALHALDWASKAVAGGAEGVVLIQGTDTLEESSYLMDLLWDRPEPLVLTGAMRTPGSAGADGPANLLAAVRTAASPGSRGLGAVVVMNDEVHAAARVRKTDATGVHAFRSPDFGPLGRLRESEVVYGNRPERWAALPRPTKSREPRVPLLGTYLGDDGTTLRLLLEDGVDGVVIGAFGAGHVAARMAEVVSDAAAKIPIVFASRTGAGPTLSHTYGFAGSESDLLHRGAVAAGWLQPRKARILLWSLLAGGAGPELVAAEFERRGGSPGGPGSVDY